jgi:predicted PolB exonuclease-like 3'-5' exonuclease
MSVSTSIGTEIASRRATVPTVGAATAYLVFDTESIPDGDLLRKVKYPEPNLTAEEAIEKARQEAREKSYEGSDFIPVAFQIPIAVCVLRVGRDFMPQRLTCLDAPQYRIPEIVKQFWRGVAAYPKAVLVTYNGRGFDLPLMELAAFDHGCPAADYFGKTRNRYGNQCDLREFMSNYGACRQIGSLDVMAKRGHRPAGVGKLDVTGDQVYDMHRAGRLREINDYCMCDTLDTYFVFLRTRVLTGELTPEGEEEVVKRAREWLATKLEEHPALKEYVDLNAGVACPSEPEA